MTVAVEIPETIYPVSGFTVGPFDTVFTYAVPGEVGVAIRTPTALSVLTGAQYTLEGASPQTAGGRVSLVAGVRPGNGWEAGTAIILFRKTATDQAHPFKDVAGYRPLVAERAWDKAARSDQDIRHLAGRSVRARLGEAGMDLPPVDARAGKFAFFRDLDGQLVGVDSLAPLASLIEDLGLLGSGTAGSFTAAGGETGIVVSEPVVRAWTLQLRRNGVPQLPTYDYTANGTATIALTSPALAGDLFQWVHTGGLVAFSGIAGVVTPEMYGARGDGTTNDLPALMLARDTGKLIVGDLSKTYGVTGELNVSTVADFRMWNVRLKQLAPGASSSPITLRAVGNNSVQLWNVCVDRNGNGAGGSQNEAAGVYLGLTRVDLKNLEVTGNDKGAGIKLVSCSGVVDSPYVHDMIAGTTSLARPANDVMDGIWLLSCVGLKVIAPRVHRLRTVWSGQASPAPCHTRGITFGGGRDIELVGPDVELVDQAIDLTGDLIPGDIAIIGGGARECRLFGVKVSNTTKRIRVYGFRAYKIGLCAFEVAGSNDLVGTANLTFDVLIDGCTADQTGYNKDAWGVLSGQSTGFKCEGNDTYPDWPRGVIFRDCRVIGGGVTQNGFVDQTTEYTSGSVKVIANAGPYRNRLEGRCVAEACTVAAFDGWMSGKSEVQAVGSGSGQSIPDNTNTLLNFNQASAEFGGGFGDGLKLLTSSSGPVAATTAVAVRYPGRYRVIAQVEFADPGAAAGFRMAEIGINNSFNSHHRALLAPVSDESTFVGVTAEMDLVAGDTISLRVKHKQGGALNANGKMTITDVHAVTGATWAPGA